MAAKRPIAVASSASAMPGATTARLVVCALEMPMKLFMMPQTVPNSPMKGPVDPTEASSPVPRLIESASARSISAKHAAMRSFTPGAARISDESFISRVASPSSACVKRSPPPSASRASERPRASERRRIAVVTRSRDRFNSIVLAMRIVHVATDASNKPIITIFTTMSALTNIVHTERS